LHNFVVFFYPVSPDGFPPAWLGLEFGFSFEKPIFTGCYDQGDFSDLTDDGSLMVRAINAAHVFGAPLRCFRRRPA
jgi:hypothetical protein